MGRSRFVAAGVLAALAALALSACGGSSSTASGTSGSLSQPGLYGKLPPAGTATHGGTITYGQVNGEHPELHLPGRPLREREHEQLRLAAGHVPAALQQLPLGRLARGRLLP